MTLDEWLASIQSILNSGGEKMAKGTLALYERYIKENNGGAPAPTEPAGVLG